MTSPDGESWFHYLNTLWIENTFNSLRDNEGRGARHKQRSDTSLMAMVISTMASRLEGDHPERLIMVDDEDASRFESFCMAPGTFRTRDARKTGLGIEANDIYNKSAWPSTTPQLFCTNILALLEALRSTDASLWPCLWMAGLIRHNMVLVDAAGRVFYVLMTTRWTISTLELEPVEEYPNLWIVRPSAERLRPIVTVTSLDRGPYLSTSNP